MTITRISEIIHERMGWCPNTGTLMVQQNSCKDITSRAEYGEKQPDTSPSTAMIPEWFTAISIIVLVATIFVGGNIWWPFAVLSIAGAGLAIMYFSNRIPGRY